MNEVPSDKLMAKTTAGIVAFIICCLLSSLRLVVDASHRDSSTEIAARSDQRFAALKADLPARGMIGYVGELGDSATPDYYLAQYALAPLVLDHSTNHKLVIGNFSGNRRPELPPALEQIRDLGDGVLLFANKDAN